MTLYVLTYMHVRLNAWLLARLSGNGLTGLLKLSALWFSERHPIRDNTMAQRRIFEPTYTAIIDE